LLNDMNEEDKD